MDESVNDNEIKIPGYKILRKDRNRNGGGVCCYIKNSIDFIERKYIGKAIESIWFSVKYKDKQIIFGTIYRPPNSTSVYYDNILSEIQRARDVCNHVIVMGDLNYNYVHDDTLSKNPVYNIEMLFDMKQLIKDPTRTTMSTKSLLDIILSSDYEQHENTTVINTSMSDHDCVYTEYKPVSSFRKQKHKQINYRDFKMFDEKLFLKDLREDPYISNLEFDESELCKRWELFKKSFITIANKHAPMKMMRAKERYYPWVNLEIVKLIYERNHIKKRAVKTKSEHLWQKLKKLRNKITLLIRKRRKEYYEEKLRECGKDSKKMWKCINKITGSKSFIPPHKDISCNNFNEHFSTIGEKIISQTSSKPENLPWKQPPCETTFMFGTIERDDVCKLIKNLGNDSNTDLLGFDSKLLALSYDIISPLLCKLFNASMSTCSVPNDWKTACITPVYKGKGDMSDKNNYRPISIITHISKIFEVLIHRQLLAYLQDKNLISIDQSAYLKFHNTQTSLHRIIDDWIDNVSFNTFTGVCAFDIKKCFDSIDHRLLLKKMQLYGVKDNELRWFESYLSNRSQIVKCHAEISHKRCINVGVPPGLSPGAYSIYHIH